MKKQKFLLAALVLLIGAAGAAAPKPHGPNDMNFDKLFARAAQ